MPGQTRRGYAQPFHVPGLTPIIFAVMGPSDVAKTLVSPTAPLLPQSSLGEVGRVQLVKTLEPVPRLVTSLSGPYGLAAAVIGAVDINGKKRWHGRSRRHSLRDSHQAPATRQAQSFNFMRTPPPQHCG